MNRLLAMTLCVLFAWKINAQDMRGASLRANCNPLQADIKWTTKDCRTIHFLAEISSGLAPYTYHWESDEGFVSDQESPSFRFERPGKHSFTVSIVPFDSCNKFYYQGEFLVEYTPVSAMVNTTERECSEIHFKTLVSGDDGNLSYQWMFGNYVFSTLKEPVFDFGGPGMYVYQLRIVKGICDTFQFSDKITVDPPMPAEAGAHFRVCYTDGPVPLIGYPEGGSWKGSGVDQNQFFPTLTTPGIHKLYYYHVTKHCQSIDSLEVIVVKPEASFQTDLLSGKAPVKIAFTATGIKYLGAQYLWDFNDPISGTNSFSKEENPVHEFTSPGNYAVTLYVSYPELNCFDFSNTSKPIAVSIPDQIFNYQFENHIALWPNPANDYVNLALDDMPFPVFKVQLIANNGEVIKSWSGLSGVQQKLALNQIKPGFYYIKVSFPGDVSYRRKLVIQ